MALILFLFFLLLSFSLERSSFPTNERHDSSTTEKVYANYVDLVLLNSTLEYNYDSSNSTLSFVFTAKPPNPAGWISWGVNPSGTGMVGAQVIAAYKDTDKRMVVRTFNLVSYNLIVAEKLLFEVWDVSAEETLGSFKIYAKLKVPVNTEMINQVWQVGPNVTEDGRLVGHAAEKENLHSKGTLRLSEGSSDSATWWKKVHAIISFICWGVFHQIGLIEARYGKKILPYPLWYYVHICWTSLTSIGGLCDVVLGLVIGSKTHGLHFNIHLVVGIILAGFAIVQLSTIVLMPKKDDQNLNYWEVVHIVVGYIISFVAPSNMYSGFKMINAEEKWVSRYTGWVITQVVIVVVDLIRKAVKGLKKWTGPADSTENPYGTVDVKKESGMQPNRLDNQ